MKNEKKIDYIMGKKKDELKRNKLIKDEGIERWKYLDIKKNGEDKEKK